MDYASYHAEGRSIIFTSKTGQRIRVTPYGSTILRVQFARANEEFFPDGRYEMVESHDWGGALQL